jgi:pyridoxine/pyridoxamine 5'-phosphate oxidase
VAAINSALEPVLNEGVILAQSRFVLLKELQERGITAFYTYI